MTLLIVIAVVPTFFSVTVLTALVVPTVTEPKLRLLGLSSAVVPVPLRGTCCGLPLAPSVNVRSALRTPVVDGLNVTLTVQLFAAASELPQVVVSPKSAASAPVTAMLVMVSDVVPTLVSVTLSAVLVKPTAQAPKFSAVGESLAVVPVPLSGTCCGLPAALSVMLTSALRAPTADGLN